MDNKKIGRLIADLRKKQGLTQQELGDKVGVGFRAVSKWERGMTLPDISIINDVSKILGISSDELLKGEVTNKEKPSRKKISKKLKITITIMLGIFLIVASLLIYINNRTYAYDVSVDVNADYFVEGEVLFVKDKMSVIISKLKFKDNNFNSMIIKNYEYEITSNNKFLFRYGYGPTTSNLEEEMLVSEFMNTFNINSNGKVMISRNEIIDNNIKLILKFIDEEDKELVKELNLFLSKK